MLVVVTHGVVRWVSDLYQSYMHIRSTSMRMSRSQEPRSLRTLPTSYCRVSDDEDKHLANVLTCSNPISSRLYSPGWESQELNVACIYAS